MGFEVDAAAGEEEGDGDGAGVREAGAVVVRVAGVGLGGVGVAEQGVVEDEGADFGGEAGEEGAGGLGVDVGASGDFGERGRFAGGGEGAFFADVLEGGLDGHRRRWGSLLLVLLLCMSVAACVKGMY